MEGNLNSTNRIWSHRLTARTSGSHPGNRGSIPRGITIKSSSFGWGFYDYSMEDESPAGSLAECSERRMKFTYILPNETIDISERSEGYSPWNL
jgi:hypothetical protein